MQVEGAVGETVRVMREGAEEVQFKNPAAGVVFFVGCFMEVR